MINRNESSLRPQHKGEITTGGGKGGEGMCRQRLRGKAALQMAGEWSSTAEPHHSWAGCLAQEAS